MDLEYRIKILDALTQKGEKILHFEDEIGIFMQNLWPSILGMLNYCYIFEVCKLLNSTLSILHTSVFLKF